MKQKQNETEHLLSTEANRNRLLEDAAERLYPDCSNVLRQMAKETFMEGAKWMQERSYSEEDLREAFRDGQGNMHYSDNYGLDSSLTEQQWFKQFKKK